MLDSKGNDDFNTKLYQSKLPINKNYRPTVADQLNNNYDRPKSYHQQIASPKRSHLIPSYDQGIFFICRMAVLFV